MRSRLASLALLPVLATVLAACGGSSSDTGADPAKAVPASAPVYLEAVVRPDGSMASDTTAALRKILRTDDPGAKLRPLIDKSASSSGLAYDRDIKPWLGQRIGVFFTSFAGSSPEGAAVIDYTDAGKARKTLDRQLRHTNSGGAPQISKRSYKGVEYSFEASDSDAEAIVGDYAVFGSEAGLKSVIDTTHGGSPLAAATSYRKARAAVSADGALGIAYAAPQAVLDAVSKSRNLGRSGQAIRQLLAQFGDTVAASFGGDGNGVHLDLAALGVPASSGGSAGAAADSVASLPGDAWLALGLGDLGAEGAKALAQIEQVGSFGNVDIGKALTGFRAQTGLDVKRDLLSWMGAGALYARGQSLVDIGAVLTIRSKDPAKSDAAVTKIGKALARAGLKSGSAQIDGYDRAIELRAPGIPIPIYVAAGGDRFSIGVNPQAMTDVARPSQPLRASPAYSAASKLLSAGERPVVVLNLPTVVRLVEGFGLGAVPGYSRVKPYLDAFGTITAGTQRRGDQQRARIAVALR